MAYDVFLKLDGIEGESLDDKHKDEIDIESFQWGLSQSGTLSGGGGGGVGKASFQDFSFTANISKASPKLFLACASGQHIKDGTITVRKAGKGQQEFLVVKMTDAFITGV
jgi:type VI secretion system secreted protein Hcp